MEISKIELDSKYNELVNEVKEVMAEDVRLHGNENTNSARLAFLESLNEYNKNFESYIKSYCELDASIFWEGTGQGEAITMHPPSHLQS